MGTYKQGILGSFSGKVGNVVGSSWRGTAYMRSLPKAVRNPKTLKQMEVRNKFSATVNMLKQFNEFIRTSYVKTGSVGPWSTAIKANIPLATKGNEGEWVLTPEKIVLSNGSKTFTGVQIDTSDLSSVNISWTKFTIEDEFYGCNICVGFYNEDTKQGVSLSFPSESGSMVLDISDLGTASSGKLHIYYAIATTDMSSKVVHSTK